MTSARRLGRSRSPTSSRSTSAHPRPAPRPGAHLHAADLQPDPAEASRRVRRGHTAGSGGTNPCCAMKSAARLRCASLAVLLNF